MSNRSEIPAMIWVRWWRNQTDVGKANVDRLATREDLSQVASESDMVLSFFLFDDRLRCASKRQFV